MIYRVGLCFELLNFFKFEQTVTGLATTNLYCGKYKLRKPIGSFGVDFYFPKDPPQSTNFVGPAPVTSKHDERGDTDCEHLNLKGDFVTVPTGIRSTFDQFGHRSSDPVVHFEKDTDAPFEREREDSSWQIPSVQFSRIFIVCPGVRVTLSARFRQEKTGGPFLHTDYTYECIDANWTADKKYNFYCISELAHNYATGAKSISYIWYRIDKTGSDFLPMRRCVSRELIPLSEVKWDYMTVRSLNVYDMSVPEFGTISLNKVREFIPHHPINRDFGPLCFTAFEDTKVLSVNTLMYLQKAVSLPKSCLDTIEDLVSSPNLAQAASAFLCYDYGVRLSTMQTKSVYQSLKDYVKVEPRASVLTDSGLDLEFLRDLFSDMVKTCPSQHDFLTCRSASPISTYSCPISAAVEEQLFFKGYYRPYDNAFSKCYSALFKLNVSISAKNIWDAIPYSFVVDWFVSIGDYLAKCDVSNYIMTLDILGCILTQRCDFRNLPISHLCSSTNVSLIGDGTLRYYLRVRNTRIPNPVSPPEISPKISFRHAVEGASLLLQRTQ